MNLLRRFEASLTYNPDQVIHNDLSEFALERKLLILDEDRTVDLRYKRHDSPYVILFSHGNRGNITFYNWFYKLFESYGYSYVTYDYPGYGVSKGEPSEKNLYDSAERAYHFVQEEFPGKAIVLFGLSLGGGPSVEMAARYGCRCLILEAAFTSTRDIGKYIMKGLPFYYFVPNRYRNIDKIESISAPVLLIHGTNDETIPFQCSLHLYEKATNPKFCLPIHGAGHADVGIVGADTYRLALRRFIETLEIQTHQQPQP